MGMSLEIANTFFGTPKEFCVSGSLEICDSVELYWANFFVSAVLVPIASANIKDRVEALASLGSPSSPIFSAGNPE